MILDDQNNAREFGGERTSNNQRVLDEMLTGRHEWVRTAIATQWRADVAAAANELATDKFRLFLADLIEYCADLSLWGQRYRVQWPDFLSWSFERVSAGSIRWAVCRGAIAECHGAKWEENIVFYATPTSRRVEVPGAVIVTADSPPALLDAAMRCGERIISYVTRCSDAEVFVSEIFDSTNLDIPTSWFALARLGDGTWKVEAHERVDGSALTAFDLTSLARWVHACSDRILPEHLRRPVMGVAHQ